MQLLLIPFVFLFVIPIFAANFSSIGSYNFDAKYKYFNTTNPWELLRDENVYEGEYYTKFGGCRNSKDIQLKFAFPFYGIPIVKLSISENGMVTFGDFDDDCQQFSVPKNHIAPLMANFEVSDDFYPSFVSYAQNAQELLVEWHQVVVKDRVDAGPFTFQLILHQRGDIVFIYKNLSSVLLKEWAQAGRLHPITIGIDIDPAFRKQDATKFQAIDLIENGYTLQAGDTIRFSLKSICYAVGNVTTPHCAECRSRVGSVCQWCQGNPDSLGNFCFDLEALNAATTNAQDIANLKVQCAARRVT